MSKQRQKQRSKARKAPATANVATETPTRRDTLRWLRNGGIAAAVVAGGGFYAVRAYEAYNTQHDLTRIGNGTPMVVQIHDPNCPVCNALKRETEQALSHFSDDRLEYVIANIRTPEGRNYANQHQVQHVTLLLVDGEGRVQNVMTGPQDSAVLRTAFEDHLKALGTS